MNQKNDLAIIVADDVELTRIMIQSSLHAYDYHDVRLAKNSIEVMEMLKERPADVVLADWIMPGIDGLELTNFIRQMDEENNRYTSIIMITSKDGTEFLVEAFDQGVDDYLQKPVNDQELAARLHSAGRISNLQTTLLETTQILEASNQELKELATTDPLTGLGNRRYIDQHLEAIITTTETRGGATACMLIDLDHFKNINDTHGHSIGDEVLSGFAKRLRMAVRPTDFVGRIGGEEFCVVMYFPEEAYCRGAIFERVLKSLNSRPILTSIGEVPITASIGVAAHTQQYDKTDTEKIMKSADEKMYQAKQAGRNQFVY